MHLLMLLLQEGDFTNANGDSVDVKVTIAQKANVALMQMEQRLMFLSVMGPNLLWLQPAPQVIDSRRNSNYTDI